MDGEREEKGFRQDSPESILFAGKMVTLWLATLLLLPGGGLLWQCGAVQCLGNWLVGNVLAHLDLTGLFT